jgi:hypothetical protein
VSITTGYAHTTHWAIWLRVEIHVAAILYRNLTYPKLPIFSRVELVTDLEQVHTPH